MTRVWVTRDEAPDGALCTALRHVGLDPVCEPVLERKLVSDIAPMLATLGAKDWLVLTSAFVAKTIPVNRFPGHIAVVGPATRQAAMQRGLNVDFECVEGTGESLWRALFPRIAPGSTVCYPRSSLARPPVPPDSTAFSLLSPVLYTTTPRAFDPAVALRADIVAVASPSAADAIAGISALPPCAAIGPTTSKALRMHHIEPLVEANPHTFEALAQAIQRVRP